MTQQRIYFNSRDKLIRIDTQKIVYFEGDGNYTYIVTANKHKVCVTMNLAHTEEALAAQLGDNARQFMRIGKRFIVNMNYIFQVDIQKQVQVILVFIVPQMALSRCVLTWAIQLGIEFPIMGKLI